MCREGTSVLRAIVGPTASGKGSLARALAGRLGAELLSVDSMKVYRRMDVGTAKPTREARLAVAHHLIDLVDPHEEFSAARYLEHADRAEAEVRSRGREPLFVGGTALYLKALRQGMFSDPGRDPDLRRALGSVAEREGAEALHRRLRSVDPVAADRIHPHDRKRIIQVYHATGLPISALQTQFTSKGRRACWLAIRWSRSTLNRRIDERVGRMMKAGFLEEVERLDQDDAFGKTSREAIGYRELLAHLAGRCSLGESVERIKVRTRQFARRQATWFRSFPDIHWIEGPEDENVASLAPVAERILGGTE